MSANVPNGKLIALARLIGGTPLLEIHCRYRGHEHRIYAKHEAYNFTGSIKDRMASRSRRSAARSGTRCASTCRTGCRASACW
jgi:cysteine synthase